MPHVPGPEPPVAFDLYVDVSGHRAQHRALTAGGYLATVSEWAAFRGAWRDILEDAGAATFHATDFFGCRRAFKHLIKGSIHHQALAHRFALAAHEHLPLGVAWSLDLATFERDVVRALRRLHTPHDRVRPEMLAVASLADAVAHLRMRPGGPRARLFLEAGTGSGEILSWLHLLRDQGEPWTAAFASFATAPKSEYAAQSADLLAYESWRETQRVLDEPSRAWDDIERETFKILAGGPSMRQPAPGAAKVEIRFATEEHYQEWVPAIAAFLRAHPRYRRTWSPREWLSRVFVRRWRRVRSTLRGLGNRLRSCLQRD